MTLDSNDVRWIRQAQQGDPNETQIVCPAHASPSAGGRARELVLQVYRFAAGKGVEVDNPAEALARKASATFVPRVRTASARARVIIPRQPLD